MEASTLLCRIDPFVVPVYAILILVVLVSPFVPILERLASHGKTRSPAPAPATAAAFRIWKRFQNLTVPKRFFRHFYFTALVWLLYVLAMAHSMGERVGVTSLALLSLHLTRRCYECYFLHQWRKTSRMHLAGYGLGLLHYVLLCLVFVRVRCTHESDSGSFETPTERLDWVSFDSSMILPTVLCLYAQYQQFRHHAILAQTLSNGKYTLPETGWFLYVVCPHYLAEVLLYIGFAVLLQIEHGAADIRHWIVLTWVVSNLTLSARMNWKYYRTNLPSRKTAGKAAIFPKIL